MTEKRFIVIDDGLDFMVRDTFAGDDLIDADGVADVLNDYDKENEQLKSTIKDVVELLEEEVDVFSDKATEHDINAYVELRELDNKDAYYMAIATKKAIKMLKELEE